MFHIPKYKAFSLIETLVAIMVITVGLLGVLALAAYILSISRTSLNELIAVNLANEGIEMVRNVRDTAWLVGSEWDNSFFSGADSTFTIDCDYNIDFRADDINSPHARLKFKDNKYQHSQGGNTYFWRLITVTENPDGYAGTEDISIQSTVKWMEHEGEYKTVTVIEYLYNWKLKYISKKLFFFVAFSMVQGC